MAVVCARQRGLWFCTFGTFLLVAVIGCMPAPTHTAVEDSARRDYGSPKPRTAPLEPGDLLPLFEVEGWVNGPPPSPGAAGVKLLVVDLWSHWCPLCAGTAPALRDLHKKYAGQGVAFMGLTNMQQAPTEGYVRKHSIPWANGYGLNSSMIGALQARSGMPGPPDYELAPTLYIVGPDRRIRWVDGQGRFRHVEPTTWARQVDEAIEATLSSLNKN